MTQLRQKMLEELQRRHYAYRTANTYLRIVRDFAAYFHRPPDKLGPEHIRQYQAYLFQSKKLSPASVSQYVSALRFLYVKTLRRHFLTEHIPFPKSPRRLPVVLSPEEVARLIDAARNLYHRTLLMTLYSTAVRRCELCRLQVSDIDSQRMMIRIHQGKGGPDRDVPLSPKLLWKPCVSTGAGESPRPICFPAPSVANAPTSPSPPTSSGWLVARQPSKPVSANPCPHTACATVAPAICWTPEPTCAPSRFCSDTPAWNTL